MSSPGGATITALDAAMKIIYKSGVEGADYEPSKLVALMPRSSDFVGKQKHVVVRYSSPQGISPSFAAAKGMISANEYSAFDVPRKKCYGFVRLDGETLNAADGNMGSVINAAKEEVARVRDEFIRYQGIMWWGDGSGALSRIKSTTTITTTTIILNNIDDAVFFQPNMKLVLTTAKTVATLVGGGATVTVTGVDEILGQITVDTATSTAIPGAATTNYIHRDGDVEVAVTGVGAYVVGGSSPGTLHGLNRNVYPTRLAGYAFDCTGKTFADAILDNLATHKRGAVPGELIFMNPMDIAVFMKQLNSQGIRSDKAEVSSKLAGVMYSGIQFFSPSGEKKVLEESNIPRGTYYCLNMKSFEASFMGSMPRLLNHISGQQFYTLENADMAESRIGFYGNILCVNPANNHVGTNLGS